MVYHESAGQDVNALVNEITDLAEAAAVDKNISEFDLRRVLGFLSKIIQVVEQAFQDVLITMIEFKYVTYDDLQSGRMRKLEKELDLLEARSRYRDAEELCSRLHHLSEFFARDIQPITENLTNKQEWWNIFGLLNEYEGHVILLVKNFLFELRELLKNPNISEINQVAERYSEELKGSLSKLRFLNSQILGESGGAGLLELTKDSSSTDKARIFVNQGGLRMGDTYKAGQAGAMGPQAHAHDMTFTQIGSQIEKSIDLSQLAEELSKLRQAMRAEATEAEHDIAVSEIAKAEKAAKDEDSSKVAQYLQSAGKWALDIATRIGVPVATEALKQATGVV